MPSAPEKDFRVRAGSKIIRETQSPRKKASVLFSVRTSTGVQAAQSGKKLE